MYVSTLYEFNKSEFSIPQLIDEIFLICCKGPLSPCRMSIKSPFNIHLSVSTIPKIVNLIF